MQTSKETLLGAHVSIAGGLHNAIDIGTDLECNAIQIFTRSNRQWAFDLLDEAEAQAFKEAQKDSPIKAVVSHASYLINIGSPKPLVRNRSLKALIAEYTRCTQADIPYLVLHPGACLESDEATCIGQISDLLSQTLAAVKSPTKILLENMAGQGSCIGKNFEQIAQIRSLTEQNKKIGVCFDTCHAFAAGYDFTTEKSYNDLWNSFDKIIGLNHLCAMHLNDSQKERGSHIDRHEDIGQGKIGLKAFRFIMNDERFRGIPKIIETPQSSPADHIRNLRVLKKLVKS